MAVSDLITALSNLDGQISSLSASVARAESYGLEGLTRRRAQLDKLIAARAALRSEIKEAQKEEAGGDVFELEENWRGC